ncbi:unnamed protein product [Tilletia laevis]|uniref:RNA helicase n=1 Tax=Tilletia controversa TaxID=13291 RepID=A0A8X7N0Q9_9BASI|nr:hypothetical protein CF328_g378 [Tilletia controversa]KAE8208698.1 hypothetical protein CF335_g223 [Tilletia laevis]KAE8254614.1 hypothetical protein A4X06_0g812 [Tilletia controversa]CAD6940160.1 unnamed protein product [Tilletia laevis]CAD6944175.1 unnamed protein product [Tilletia controversa]
MSAGHLFSTLTGGGVYFDKKKYADDLAIFKQGGGADGSDKKGNGKGKGKGRSGPTTAAAATTKAAAPALTLPAELDFFGSSSKSAAGSVADGSAPPKGGIAEKKRKRSAKDDQQEEDDDSDSDSDGDEAGDGNASTDKEGSTSKKSKPSKKAVPKPSNVHQRVLYVGSEEGKLHAVRQLVIDGELKPPVVLFVQSVQRAQELYSEFAYDNLRIDVIHPDRPPSQRRAVMEKFRQGEVWVLIATDPVAYMVDTASCNLVISYDFPQSAERYTTRIARTGRAGKEGKAVTFFTKEDGPHLKLVVNVMKLAGTTDIPPWLLALPNLSKNDRKNLKRVAPQRTDVKDAAGTSTFGRKKAMKKADMVAGSKRRFEKGVVPRPKQQKKKEAEGEAGDGGESKGGDE